MSPEFSVLDLFSGIGGFSLGLRRAGFQTIAFCEANPFCQSVLRRHWPGVPVHRDVRTFGAEGLHPFLVCGGFPCQDASQAGPGGGLGGERTGLWSQMARIVGECRPRWVVAENVPGLRSRGADRVCADLDALGFTVWPLVVGAVHAGAPHRRRRVFILARQLAADAAGAGLALGQRQAGGAAPGVQLERHGGWSAEPCLRRVVDGVPARVDRVMALGNAVVPTVAAMIGRAIRAAEAST